MAKGSRLPCTEGVRVGVIPKAFTFLSMGTGEPDDAKVSCPVRGGTGRKGSNDLARGLPYLLHRCGCCHRKLCPRAVPQLPRYRRRTSRLGSVGVARLTNAACESDGVGASGSTPLTAHTPTPRRSATPPHALYWRHAE